MAFQPTIAQPNEPRVSVLAERVYRHVLTLEDGALMSYTALRQLLFENPQGRRGRAAILQARNRLLREDQRLLVNVRDKGYQVVPPNAHLNESRRVDTLARRRHRWALRIVLNTELSKLTPQERQQVDEQGNRLRIKLALDLNMAKAKVLSSAPDDVVFPIGRRLAALLAHDPNKEEAS